MPSIKIDDARNCFLTELAINGTLSIRECVDLMMARSFGEQTASYAVLRDVDARSHCSWALEALIDLLRGHEGGPVIEPDAPTAEQSRILTEWVTDRGDWETADEVILDSVRWKFCDGWANRFTEIPAWKWYSFDNCEATL